MGASPVTAWIESARRKLEDFVRDNRARSATLYVRDPHWTKGFRLVAMHGVEYTEPMHGFNFPLGLALDGGATPREYFGPPGGQRRKLPRDPPAGLDPVKQRLFSDFVGREEVRAVARLVFPTGGEEPAALVLFLNFDREWKFSDAIKAKLRAFVKTEIAPLCPGLVRELEAADAPALSKSVRVLSPDKTIAIQDASLFSTGPGRYLDRILLNTFDAFGLDRSHDTGAIYLHDPEDSRLRLEASTGAGSPAKELSVAQGEGIAAWVAHRQTGLLIEDVQDSGSRYRSIYSGDKGAARSVIAVPMILGEEVAGVVVLEAALEHTFTPADVRPVWYAANRAAAAVWFYRQQSLNQDLMRLCVKASGSGVDASATLNDLAGLAKQHLFAVDSDIWTLDRHTRKIEPGGASYVEPIRAIRPGGWTKFILDHKTPVWIHDIRSATDFKVLYGSDAGWSPEHPASSSRPKLNPAAIAQGMRCELGIPLISGKDAAGVAWVRYRQGEREPPKPSVMTLATGFAAEAALVIEALRNRKEILSRAGAEERIQRKMFGNWQLARPESIEVVVNTQPAEANLGGDFFAVVTLEGGRTGILIGDGEGHSVLGSLNMLALWSAFQASRDSCSTTYVMERIARMARDVGVKGTGLYGILTPFDGGLSLSATSADHASFLILRRKPGGDYTRFDVPGEGIAHGPPFGDANHLGEDRLTLLPGDVVACYTDGICEASYRPQLQATIARGLEKDKPLTLDAIAESILAEALSRQAADERDDATILLFRVMEPPKPRGAK